MKLQSKLKSRFMFGEMGVQTPGLPLAKRTLYHCAISPVNNNLRTTRSQRVIFLHIFTYYVALKLHIARKCIDVKFDNAAAKAVFSIHFIEYNMVPELIQICRPTTIRLYLVSS